VISYRSKNKIAKCGIRRRKTTISSHIFIITPIDYICKGSKDGNAFAMKIIEIKRCNFAFPEILYYLLHYSKYRILIRF